jgi:hypothetical protein
MIWNARPCSGGLAIVGVDPRPIVRRESISQCENVLFLGKAEPVGLMQGVVAILRTGWGECASLYLLIVSIAVIIVK